MFNVVNFLTSYNIPHVFKGKNLSNGWVGINCPFCGDSGFHGGFNIAGGYFYCWKCGNHALFEIIQTLLHGSSHDTLRIMRDFETTYTMNIKEKKEGVTYVEIPKEPLSKREREYLEKRGYDSDYLEKTFLLSSGGIAGTWKFRIVIPILLDNNCVSLQGRSIAGQDPRYLFLSEDKSVIPAKHTLYNIDNCTGDQIILVEGVFSVFRMGNGFASTMGAKMSSEQIAQLTKYKKVIFLFDTDDAGIRNANKYATVIASLGIEVEVIQLKEANAPDDLSDEEASKLRRILV